MVNLSGDSSPPQIAWQLETVPRSRDICWNENCPSEDLRAQLLIALAQLGVMQVDECLTRELERYLRKNFGSSIKWAVKKHRLTGKQVAERACAEILENYSFAEHPHGFRLYIKQALRWSPGSGEAEYEPQIDTAKESYTVPEAAFHLRVSKDVIYRLIRDGKIAAQPDSDGLMRLPHGELIKVAAYQLEKLKRKKEQEELQNEHNKSYEAARKAVYRKRGRLSLPGDSHQRRHEPEHGAKAGRSGRQSLSWGESREPASDSPQSTSNF